MIQKNLPGEEAQYTVEKRIYQSYFTVPNTLRCPRRIRQDRGFLLFSYAVRFQAVVLEKSVEIHFELFRKHCIKLSEKRIGQDLLSEYFDIILVGFVVELNGYVFIHISRVDPE